MCWGWFVTGASDQVMVDLQGRLVERRTERMWFESPEDGPADRAAFLLQVDRHGSSNSKLSRLYGPLRPSCGSRRRPRCVAHDESLARHSSSSSSLLAIISPSPNRASSNPIPSRTTSQPPSNSPHPNTLHVSSPSQPNRPRAIRTAHHQKNPKHSRSIRPSFLDYFLRGITFGGWRDEDEHERQGGDLMWVFGRRGRS